MNLCKIEEMKEKFPELWKAQEGNVIYTQDKCIRPESFSDLIATGCKVYIDSDSIITGTQGIEFNNCVYVELPNAHTDWIDIIIEVVNLHPNGAAMIDDYLNIWWD